MQDILRHSWLKFFCFFVSVFLDQICYDLHPPRDATKTCTLYYNTVYFPFKCFSPLTNHCSQFSYTLGIRMSRKLQRMCDPILWSCSLESCRILACFMVLHCLSVGVGCFLSNCTLVFFLSLKGKWLIPWMCGKSHLYPVFWSDPSFSPDSRIIPYKEISHLKNRAWQTKRKALLCRDTCLIDFVNKTL